MSIKIRILLAVFIFWCSVCSAINAVKRDDSPNAYLVKLQLAGRFFDNKEYNKVIKLCKEL